MGAEEDRELLCTAVSLLDRGHVDSAVEMLEALRPTMPHDPVVLGSLGRAALARGAYGEAEQLLNSALESDPGFYPALLNKGILLVNLGDCEGAIALYDRALEVNPRYPEAHSNRANALAILGRVEEALKDYGRALELKPGFADAHYNYAYTLSRMGRTDDALGELEHTVRLQPAHRLAWQLKLCIHVDRGEAEEAQRCQDSLGKLGPP
ncbi:tetratricopeptide repeat protein [Candidatus Fermentibacteria bacterium]|nr:tetratricopeptide repeat protein [Candidatus Fermentibacteria bacterium]